jgi:hypothetical protein
MMRGVPGARYARRIGREGDQIELSDNIREKRINLYRSQSLNDVFAPVSIVSIEKGTRQ